MMNQFPLGARVDRERSASRAGMQHVASNGRVVMLALSGCLFAATLIGWFDYAGRHPERSSAGAAVNAVQASSRLADAQQNSQAASASGTATSAPQALYLVPATSPALAALEASAGAGRTDPMAPPAVRGVMVPPPPVSSAPGGILPPPPPPVSAETTNAQPMLSWNEVPLVDVVRLVGLMDGKAFFAMPREVARDKHLPYSFTIGPGEQFADLRVEGMTESSVTLRCGNKVCVKELGAIR